MRRSPLNSRLNRCTNLVPANSKKSVANTHALEIFCSITNGGSTPVVDENIADNRANHPPSAEQVSHASTAHNAQSESDW